MSKGLHPISKKAYGDIHRIWLPLVEEETKKTRGAEEQTPEETNPLGEGAMELLAADHDDQEAQDIQWAREQWSDCMTP